MTLQVTRALQTQTLQHKVHPAYFASDLPLPAALAGPNIPYSELIFCRNNLMGPWYCVHHTSDGSWTGSERVPPSSIEPVLGRLCLISNPLQLCLAAASRFRYVHPLPAPMTAPSFPNLRFPAAQSDSCCCLAPKSLCLVCCSVAAFHISLPNEPWTSPQSPPA
jgi:hypothetical protein